MSIQDTKRKRSAAQHTGAPAAPAGRQRPVVGTYAQVSLLPRELRLGDRRRVVRRRLIAGVVVTAVVVAGGVAASAALAVGATGNLASQTVQQAELAQQLQRYGSVQQLDGALALDMAAIRVGSSTAIDWDPEIDRVKRQIPGGFSISAISTDSATPIADYPQGSTPLDTPRAASVTITAKAHSIASLPSWISAVTALPEVADASPSVSSGDGGVYTVVLTVHLTTKAYITPLTSGAAK